MLSMTTDGSEFFQPFYGQSFTNEDCDILTVSHINQKLTKVEPTLKNSCWFDYRFLHPMKATYLFADCYVKAYKRSVEMCVDINKAPYVKGLKSEDFLECDKATISGFWTARQKADLEGIPYDFWNNKAQKYAYENLWVRFPRPVHLYSEDMVNYIRSEWISLNEASPVLPINPFFKENQDDKLDVWIKSLVYLRHNPEFFLSTLLRQGFLTEERLKELFSDELARRALLAFRTSVTTDYDSTDTK